MRKQIVSILLVTVSLASFGQQRPVMSTYMFNGLALNPAYAGSLNIFSASFVHRKQWINVEGVPTSNIFTANTSLHVNQLGIGIQSTRD